jgi:hypothetical protein
MKDMRTESKKILFRLSMTTRTSEETSSKNKEDSPKLSSLTTSCAESKGKKNFNRPIESGAINFDQERNHV